MNYEAVIWERKAPVGTPSRLRTWHCISDSSGSKTRTMRVALCSVWRSVWVNKVHVSQLHEGFADMFHA